jgi:hypothetical protein
MTAAPRPQPPLQQQQLVVRTLARHMPLLLHAQLQHLLAAWQGALLLP